MQLVIMNFTRMRNDTYYLEARRAWVWPDQSQRLFIPDHLRRWRTSATVGLNSQ
jgi:hypothetical protein